HAAGEGRDCALVSHSESCVSHDELTHRVRLIGWSGTRADKSIRGRDRTLPGAGAGTGASEKSWLHFLSLNAEYARIWPNITVRKAPPPDSKEWEGKPDKLQYFSPNPVAGD